MYSLFAMVILMMYLPAGRARRLSQFFTRCTAFSRLLHGERHWPESRSSHFPQASFAFLTAYPAMGKLHGLEEEFRLLTGDNDVLVHCSR